MCLERLRGPGYSHHVTAFSSARCHCSVFTREYAETKKKKLHGLCPRANYTDRAAAACW
jgi:hypothetical protein